MEIQKQSTVNKRNTLLFVHISTHFKEMIRVARLMKTQNRYNPVVFFVTPYEGWKANFKLCQSEGIECFTYFDTSISNTVKIKSRVSKTLKACMKVRYYFRQKIFKVAFIIKAGLKKIVLLMKRIYVKAIFKLKKYGRLFLRFMYRIFSRKTWSYLLLSYYKFMWERSPRSLPILSRLAHDFYVNLPRILKDKNIELIVLPEHNLFYFTQLLVFIGRKNNIHSIIVPFTIANTLEWSEAFYNEPSRSLRSIYNQICSYAFPHWVNFYKNRKLMLPVDLVLLHELLRITPKNPWLLNCGDIDFIATESEAMNNYYVTAGIEEKRLRAVGALYNDELFFKLKNAESYRYDVCQLLEMDPNKPIILCALPPNQCFGRESVIEFVNYEEIIRFILSELSKHSLKYNIVLNLHPRIVPTTVAFINDYPVKVFAGDIAEIVPLSAIYVSSCSATIRMAIACSIPVLNYDLYRYRYDDYVNNNGVVTIFNRDDFSLILDQLAEDTNFYNKIKDLQIKDSTQWGTLDGKAGVKLLNEIDSLFA